MEKCKHIRDEKFKNVLIFLKTLKEQMLKILGLRWYNDIETKVKMLECADPIK